MLSESSQTKEDYTQYEAIYMKLQNRCDYSVKCQERFAFQGLRVGTDWKVAEETF